MNTSGFIIVVMIGIMGLTSCVEKPTTLSSNPLGTLPNSQQRMWQYSHAVQSGQASSLLDSPNDPLPSDQSLISQSKANYILRGYDPKKAEQCAKDDFISAEGRFPNPHY